MEHVATQTAPPRPIADETVYGTLMARGNPGRRWLAALCVLLAGYSLVGKSFAYLGVPPLFIGEIVLALGLVVYLRNPAWRKPLSTAPVLLMLGLFAWGAAQTLPYVPAYGLDAPRDAMIWIYGLFAIFVSAVLLGEPDALPWLIDRYKVFVRLFLAIVPALWIIQEAIGEPPVRLPWAANVAILELKPGDTLVQLAAIGALGVAGGFHGASRIWLVPFVMGVATTGAANRGGLVSFCLAFALAFSLRPQSGWARRMFITALICVALVGIIDPRLKLDKRHREISVGQLFINLGSILGSTEAGDLDATKRWRLEWWQQIVDYTFFGEHFLTGKGFGVNLADSDGFQVYGNSSLRSPHNGHLTMLARAGVPGIALWFAVQASWLWVVGRGFVTSRRHGQVAWQQLFIVLLAWWVAFLVNTNFDVFLEGPMGGIWFWTVFGVGVAATELHRRRPELLDAPARVAP